MKKENQKTQVKVLKNDKGKKLKEAAV